MSSPAPPPVHRTQRQQFGLELRHWREKRGLTAAALAAQVGKDRRTITAAEAGRDIPSEAVVHHLEETLQTEGLLLARYDAVLAEKRRARLLRAVPAALPSPHADPADASTFVSETVPDGTLMPPGHRFIKTWTIRNSGVVPWQSRRISRIGIAAGPGLITTPAEVILPDTLPGEEVTVVVPCVAHWVEGASIASFKMTDAEGRLFFPGRYFIGLQVQVTVVRGPITSPGASLGRDERSAPGVRD